MSTSQGSSSASPAPSTPRYYDDYQVKLISIGTAEQRKSGGTDLTDQMLRDITALERIPIAQKLSFDDDILDAAHHLTAFKMRMRWVPYLKMVAETNGIPFPEPKPHSSGDASDAQPTNADRAWYLAGK